MSRKKASVDRTASVSRGSGGCGTVILQVLAALVMLVILSKLFG
jgi:hypothetical protein